MPNRAKRDERDQVRSFGAPLGPAARVEGVQRPQPREADPETRRSAIAEHERQAREEALRRLRTTPSMRRVQPPPDPATRDLSAMTAARRLRDRRHVIEDTVDQAVIGGRRRR